MFDDDERGLPIEAREIHQRLVRDSSHWTHGLPDDTGIAEFARTLPQRVPSPSVQQTRNVLAHRRPSSTRPDMMSSKGQTGMFERQRPGRTLVASFAAIAVVALIAGVLYTMHTMYNTGPGSGGKNTVTPYPQGNYGATPGPLANYISELYTTGDDPANGTPGAVKSHFMVGDQVYVVMRLHDLPEGPHTISSQWYLDGDAQEGSSGSLSAPDVGAKLIFFSLKVPQPGAYMARVYLDRPATDTSDSPSDPYLVGTVVIVTEAP